jgi:4-amino-4-deoxy-L-arabinose transferase-like glycosyltransferase
MRCVKDPLNLISLTVSLVWLVVAIWFRPIGDFGVETDFYGDFVPFAGEWMNGHPSIMLGYRGPFYYLLIGVLSFLGDPFLLAKILSAVCAGISIRVIGGMLRRLWNPTVAVGGALFLAANLTLIDYSFRASTDLVYLALFAGSLALFFTENARHYRTWALAGICAGLAYLTRYNGAMLVPMGLVAVLVMIRPWPRAAMTALAFVAAWLAVTGGWLWFLWNQTGDPFWNRNFALIAEEVYGTDPNLANIGQLVDSVGFSSFGEVVLLDPGRFFRAVAGNIPRHLWLDIKFLLGPIWAVLGLAGYVVSFRAFRNRRCLGFAMAGVIAFCGLLPVFYNQRFMLTLLIWWAAGLGNTVHFLMIQFERLANRGSTTAPPTPGIRIIRGVLMAALVVAVILATTQGIRRSQGAAGGPSMPLALLNLAASVKESGIVLGEATPIAARKPHIGYYLGAPVGSLATRGVLNDLAASGMKYLLVSDIEGTMFPVLAPMLTDRRPVRDFPGYRWLDAASHQEKSGRKQTATLYAVENPAAWVPPITSAVRLQAPTPQGLDRLDFLRTRLAVWYLNWTVTEPVLPLFTMMNPASRTHPLVKQAEGDAYLADKDYGRAVNIYEDLMEGPGNSVDTVLRLALASHLAGESDRFEHYLNEYADRWDADTDPTLTDWLNEAAARCRVSHFAPAAGLLHQILLLDPEFNSSELFRMLGFCYLNLRHPDRARDAFARYLELVPDDPEILSVLKDDSRLAPSRR